MDKIILKFRKNKIENIPVIKSHNITIADCAKRKIDAT